MNKNAIKNFAIWARDKLIADVVYQAGLLGVTEKGIAQPLPQSTGDVQFFDIGTKDYITLRGDAIRQRQAFVDAIWEKEKEIGLREAFRFVVEKVAYTWFNRMIAIRFMEVNDYLPGHIRVLSSENPQKAEPDMVTTPFDTDLAFSAVDRDEIARLRDENKLDQLFRMLFIRQCRKLHEVLPVLFEEGGTGHRDSYLELLLTISFTDRDGVLWHLVHDICEDDFDVSKEGQVAIIGWLYQYYNTEPKKEVFANLDKKIKIDKDHIPAATQLFTPDWIVRYMVENSLGRLWVEGHPDVALQATWRYYLPEAEQEPEVAAQLAEIRKQSAALKPEDILVIDPCMGSGHILVYLFDVLMQIYTTQGWTARDAVESIITKNLWGLDIDDRAAQLAYFAVMMKAREYDRGWFRRGIEPNVFALQDSPEIDTHTLALMGDQAEVARRMLDAFRDAKEYGSIIQPDVTLKELHALTERLNGTWRVMEETNTLTFMAQLDFSKLARMICQCRALVQKYHVVVTNPPYMGSSGMNSTLGEYIKVNFPDSKSDLFSVFIERGFAFLLKNGYESMITMEAWMFLTSFEKLRKIVNAQKTITTLVHMPYLGKGGTSLGINFGTDMAIIQNSRIPGYIGTYDRISYCDTDADGVPIEFPVKNTYYRFASQDNFTKIPGAPIAYWISDRTVSVFDKSPQLGHGFIDARIGMVSGDNDRFLRLWFEVDFNRIEFMARAGHDPRKKRWYPLQKGGEFRLWYGNLEYIIDWEKDGDRLKNDNFSGTRVRSHNYNGVQQFKSGITWNSITTSKFHCRFSPPGFTYDAAGPLCEVLNESDLYYLLGLLSSKVTIYLFNIVNPTINFPSGYLESLPVLFGDRERVNRLVSECISISRADWDSFESSWDFTYHPLIVGGLMKEPIVMNDGLHFVPPGEWSGTTCPIETCWQIWETACANRFHRLMANEEELNRIFIEIYGLQDELTPEVADEDVTVRRADLGRDIRSLVSYAVGCMMGRYSLDVPGLAYAGGKWDASKYVTYQPDTDNCLVIPPEDYGMKDDIVNRFVDFIRIVYGEAYLEENLAFIANALGTKGDTSRERIRNYFLHDFIKDHIRIYQKRPIYWLFDSGKQDGFKALVYMHRWTADTVGNMRVEYLHRLQRLYESEITRMQEIIDNSTDARESNRARVRLEKLRKRLQETRDYDQRIAHVALSRVAIDLDDGVKVNYDKVQQGPNGENLGILAKL